MRFSSLLVLGLASQVQADKIPVTQLTDATFELLTQAATGATTGDWLVHFTPNKCEDCPAVMNMLDELAPKYGRWNPLETCKRFGITDKPVMMFLHHGLLYVYTGSRALKGIDAFAKGGWREMSGVKVPEEQGWLLTQMDSIGQMFSQVVRGFEANHNPEDYKILQSDDPLPLAMCFAIGFSMAIFVLFLFILMLYYCGGSTPTPIKDKSKKD